MAMATDEDIYSHIKALVDEERCLATAPTRPSVGRPQGTSTSTGTSSDSGRPDASSAKTLQRQRRARWTRSRAICNRYQ